ncbi:hypothetical protein KGQ64_08560 [bacterium]|nr:hypothetical protein [bacterium]
MRRSLAATLLAAALALEPEAVRAQTVVGPNTDFPDANVLMPFDATGPRVTYFSLSCVGNDNLSAQWFFYDENGRLLAQVSRAILSAGGTDVVDVTRVQNRVYENNQLVETGNPQSFAGKRGFVVVSGSDLPVLAGAWTIANTQTNAAFGGASAGFGVIGGLAPGPTLVGTTFNPATLQDSELILIGLNPSSGNSVTTLTNGNPPPGGVLMKVTVELRGNTSDGLIAKRTIDLSTSALFSPVSALFPGSSLNSSATIVAYADEGPAYSPWDPDADNTTLPLIGFYGQTLGAFGAGQNLRTLIEG